MTRQAIRSVLLLCAALALVLVGAVYLMRRDRAALIDQYAENWRAQVKGATQDVSDALEDVGDDLRFAGELLAQPRSRGEHERELRALLEVVGQYKAIAVYGWNGEERFKLVDRRVAAEVSGEPFDAALAETSLRAMSHPPGGIVTSTALPDPLTGWFRVFATSFEGGAVSVLIDTEPFFAPFRLIASQEDSHLLLLGAHGMPTPATPSVLTEWFTRVQSSPAEAPGLSELIRRMRAAEEGTARIGEVEAERLGLGAAEAVAAFAPIRVKGGAHWSVATLASTTALRSHEQAVVLRLSMAATAIGLLLAGFGIYVVRASRRAVELRESRRHASRLAQVLDNIPAGVLALSSRGEVTMLNRTLRAHTPGVTAGAGLAQTFPAAPEPALERLGALVESACAAGRVVSIQGEPMALFGEEGQFRIHAVPLEPKDPEARVLLVVEDLSDIRALESQLLRAEKLATVGILAAGIAHEIGTPLGVVRGRAEYIHGKLGPSHPQAPGLATITEEIDRVSRTIRTLLDFSRVQPPEVQAVALAPLAESVGELLRLEAERRRVSIAVEVPESLPPLSADLDQLRQVLVNLCLNACDACAPGGVVRLQAEAGSPSSGSWGQVEIRLRDDGCGIPAENLNQVFDPFFTTKKRGQGTGLGLTMVAQIVRNHGAQVEISSEPGRGTLVKLTWPAAPLDSEERHAV